MEKLVYGMFEGLTFKEVAEIAEAADGKMLIKVINHTSRTFRLAAYGMMEETLAESYGFEDANCSDFQETETYQATKRTYEYYKSQGEFK